MNRMQYEGILLEDEEQRGFFLRAALLSSKKYRHLLLLVNLLGLDKTMLILHTLGGSRLRLPLPMRLFTQECFLTAAAAIAAHRKVLSVDDAASECRVREAAVRRTLKALETYQAYATAALH